MDKFEYELKVEQIEKLVARGDFSTAKKIADSMEWKKEKDPKLLSHVAELYAQAGDIEKALKIYNFAYNASSRGLLILERMTELAIIFGQLDLAEELVEEYRGAGAYEPDYYMFKYQIAEGRGEDYIKRIPYLEKYCDSELDEDAMYQLAWLYDRAGMTDKCVKMCDFIIDYFCFGENVDHAIALKLNHAKLNEYQERRVTNADEYKQSYESYLQSQSDEEKREKSERKVEEKIRQDAIMEQQENDLGKQVSEIVEQNEREKQEINLKALVAEEEAVARISFPTAASTVPEEPEAEKEPVEEIEEDLTEEVSEETKADEEESIEEALAGEIDAILSENILEKEDEGSPDEVLDVLMKEIEAVDTVEETDNAPETEKIELENIDELIEETINNAEAEDEEATDSEEISEEVKEQPEELVEEPIGGVVEEQLEDPAAEAGEDAGEKDADITIEEAIKAVSEELDEEAVPDAEIEDIILEVTDEAIEENTDVQAEILLEEIPKEEVEPETVEVTEEEAEPEAEEVIEEQAEPETEEVIEEQSEPEAEELTEEETKPETEEIIEEQAETVEKENTEELTEEPAEEPKKRVKRNVDFSALDIVVPEGSFRVACSDMEMGVKYAIELVRLVPSEERADHVARVSANRMNKGKFSSVEQQLDRDILLITNAGQLTNTSLDNIYAWMKKSMENKVIFVDDVGSLMELEKRRPKLMKRITGDYAYEKKDTAEWLDIVDSYVDENNCVLADDAYHLFEDYLNDKEEKDDVVLGITLKEAVQDALHMASKISFRNMISSIADTKYDEDGLLILRDRHFL